MAPDPVASIPPWSSHGSDLAPVPRNQSLVRPSPSRTGGTPVLGRGEAGGKRNRSPTSVCPPPFSEPWRVIFKGAKGLIDWPSAKREAVI